MTNSIRRRIVAATILATALTASACSFGKGDDKVTGKPAERPPVALDIAAPTNLKIGVVVSGEETTAAAEGVRIAEYRIDALGTENRVDLEFEDDKGNADSGAAVVERLADKGVAGIVYLADGPQLTDAVAAAEKRGIPILLPYATGAGLTRGSEVAWRTGPTIEDETDALKRWAATEKKSFTILATADAGDIRSRLGASSPVLELPGDAQQMDAAVADISDVTDDQSVILIWADPIASAEAVAALQRAEATSPIVLSSRALMPSFSTRLEQLARLDDTVGTSAPLAALDSNLMAVGPAASDLDTTSGMTGFLEALEIASRDAAYQALNDGGGKAAVGGASWAAHDAVIALANAAANAKSTEPADVRKALSGLEGGITGIAGPPLDFTQRDALVADSIAMLTSDVSASTLRSGIAGAPRLTWYRSGTAS